jgi:hypothetical protein
MDAAAAPRRHPLRLASLVTGGAVLVLAAAALVLYVWLRGYAPLEAQSTGFAPGPGLGADVEPVAGSGGKTVFEPHYAGARPFDTAFTLHNDGRFAVTVTGLGGTASHPEIRPSTLLGSDSTSASADPTHLRPFRDLRLEPGDTATVVVRWQLDCAGSRNGQVFADSVALRYRYLAIFRRTARVELPFAVTLRCGMGRAAQP